MSDEKTRRKRISLNEGDLFELVVPDGRLGYGIIVKRGILKNGGAPYIAIFGSVHAGRPDPNWVVRDDVALAGWTLDSLFYHGHWNVIARSLPLPSIPFPNFKVEQDGRIYVTDVTGAFVGEASQAEIELLDYQFSRTPLLFQDAFEALHGFQTWNQTHDKLTPAYSKVRATRLGQ
ncbi:Imm26 family immunity protein [Sphingomonas aerophila]|jgi:hypothetical protein|uniref:Immunity protein 26 of polymorphic toxin system n=1 Tax=Sphingomonas aerophila TaxID=1344948 RepID=A0A7W9BBH3_9SPHN|nr:Imm26 family immunity protein [Sphingomonas aerophila]MBB5714160.1 hypothetical protein [Sphingomonas aerophila]